MKKMQTKTIIGIILAAIAGIILIIWTGLVIKEDCVKPAIQMGYALLKRDNTNYFIIKRYRESWEGWYYIDGFDGMEKTPVRLLGRTPQSELSTDLSGNRAGNSFLVKGTLLTEYSEFTGMDVLMVESWEIIAPIRRIYGRKALDSRLVKPMLYLDRYDVEIGAYFKIITDMRALDSLEQKLIWKNSEIPCYYITSDVINGEAEWYLIKGDGVLDYIILDISSRELIPISLEGVPLESHFNEEILLYFNNVFLVKGEFDSENGILEVMEWYIVSPIKREYDIYNSPDYFTEEDLRKGVYIP